MGHAERETDFERDLGSTGMIYAFIFSSLKYIGKKERSEANFQT